LLAQALANGFNPDMTDSSETSQRLAASTSWLKRLLVKLARLFMAGLVLGLGYSWAAPWMYRAESTPGFWRGTLHGAMMPVALPSLLLGQNVPIYADNNSGRTYKLGYIAGINACGLFFFGSAFWRPSKTKSPPAV
jgi:hypothetical protein